MDLARTNQDQGMRSLAVFLTAYWFVWTGLCIIAFKLVSRIQESQTESYLLMQSRMAPNVASHSGKLILVFGLLSLFGMFPLGITAWIMGTRDLKEMAAGTMDSAGRSMTKAGKIMGIISIFPPIFMIVAIFVGIYIISLHINTHDGVSNQVAPVPPSAVSPASSSVPLLPTTSAPPMVTMPAVPPAIASEYILVKGDTLRSVATKYGVTIKAIMQVNPEIDSRKLRIGQKIMIPSKSAVESDPTP